MILELLPLFAPLALIVASGLAFRRPGRRPGRLPRWAEAAGLVALGIAALSALSLLWGPTEDPAGITWFNGVAAVMLLLVSFVGWVVLRFAATYLDGEDRQGEFTAWLCATLASVMLLVQAGHLVLLLIAWVSTSLCLHRLLVFYPDRIEARRAARKKFLTARIGDLALTLAAISLGMGYGTGDLALISEAARGGEIPAQVPWAAGLIALAAILKSAQFPTHGWLTEVMETPTPVSALLHAGVINAGGFLLIRFADLMLLAPGVLAVLVMIGGLSALFGGLVMLTQSAVKTSLAWSTVAQMGFLIMQCGLALFPLALLHIVAHSLYKAHAFLAAGGAVSQVAAIHRPGPVAVPCVDAVGRAFLLALGIYLIVGAAFGFEQKSPQAIMLGAILIFGVAYLIAQGLADAAPAELMRRTTLYSLAAAFGYFGLQTGMDWLMSGSLPATPSPGALEWALMVVVVFSFGLVAFGQATFPLWAYHPAVAGLRVHLVNGLYANALFDRLVKGWSLSATPQPSKSEVSS